VFDTAVREVSILQLIATPEKYDGRSVRVTAFLHLEFEGNALYLHREDFENAILANSVAIHLTDVQIRAFKNLQNGYVIVEGRVNAKEHGHLGIWPGSLHQISRLSCGKVSRK
jgi:hypothetical protein